MGEPGEEEQYEEYGMSVGGRLVSVMREVRRFEMIYASMERREANSVAILVSIWVVTRPRNPVLF